MPEAEPGLDEARWTSGEALEAPSESHLPAANFAGLSIFLFLQHTLRQWLHAVAGVEALFSHATCRGDSACFVCMRRNEDFENVRLEALALFQSRSLGLQTLSLRQFD